MPGTVSRRFTTSFAFAAIAAAAIHPAAPAALQTSWPSPPPPARDRWQSWNPIPITAAVNGFWASGPDDVWAWGDKEVMRWNGRGWTRVYPPVKQPIDAIWGAANDVWLRASHHVPRHQSRDLLIAGYLETSLLHWNGRAWSSAETRRILEDDDGQLPSSVQKLAPRPEPDKTVGREELEQLWARHAPGRKVPAFRIGHRTSDVEIWAADADGRQVAHFDGRAWTVGTRLASSDFSAVRMIGAGDGWAVSRRPVSGPAGDGLFRWDGQAWRFFQPLSERVHALWAGSANDVWAVGQNGLVMHWDGARWSKWSNRLAGDLHAIWGRSRDDVWINGCADNFYHWNGAAWITAPNPVPADYAGVCPALWGASASDVSAIGQDRFLRWNGANWKFEPNPLKGNPPLAPNGNISALWSATPGGDLWAVGWEDGGIGFDGWPLTIRRHAGRWTKLPTPRTEGRLQGIWGNRDDDVWAVGSKGLILHWDGKGWSQEESGVIEQLSSIHGAGGTVWIAGERGTLLVRSLDAAGQG